MTRLGVLGAGGFVGSRLVELSVLDQGALGGVQVLPIFRQPRGLGRNSKLGLSAYRYADARKIDSLVAAFAGCDVVLNLTMGDDARILPDLQNIHAACMRAGVARLIHISSAEVYGRCDQPGLTDDSPWDRHHWMEYARAKGRAEDWLRTRTGELSIIVLRPGLIWGPRSPWVAGPAQSILDGTAYLVDGGRGTCNLCHVDNMLQYIAAAAVHPGPVAGFFNMADLERKSWQEYYQGLAAELNVPTGRIAHFAESDFRESVLSSFLALKDSALARTIKRRMSNAMKEDIKARVSRLRRRWWPADEGPARPVLSRGMWWLQTTRYPLPTAKIESTFPLARPVTFSAALSSVGDWLRFSGYNNSNGH